MGGSLSWEYAGENTTPLINDRVATGIGGLLFGEPSFRVASLLLEAGDSGGPGIGALRISCALLGQIRAGAADSSSSLLRSRCIEAS